MNLNINLITNNKKISQTVKPLFSTKLKHKEIINLVENETIHNPKFSFNFVSFKQTLHEINKHNPKKAFQTADIPAPIIKGNKDDTALFIYLNFHNSLSSSSFPTGLKYVDVRPVFIKDHKTDKENYRSIRILSNIRKGMRDLCMTSCILTLMGFF